MNDEALRALYARATAARGDPARAACPAPEALLALVRREGAEEGRLRTLDHAMACADCRADFELLRAIESGRRREAGDAVRQLRWRRPLGVALAAIAAALLVVALLPRAGWWPILDRVDEVRGSENEVVVVAPGDEAVLAGGAPTFVWHPVAGARRYRLEVFTADGATRAAVGPITDTTATLPAGALAPGDYRWTVSAELDGGAARSALRRLRVTR